MSSASAPRTSPTTIRSGRIRSAFFTSRRIVTSPRPSRFGGRASSRRTCGWRSRSSAASSIVTTRSPGSMKLESALSSVVLPEPVPPQTSRLQRRRDRSREELGERRGQRPVGHELLGREAAAAEAADGQHRAVERERRDHHVDARAVGQAGVDERLGLVDAPAERREDALDRVPELAVAGEADVGGLEPPVPLDPGGRGAGDEDLVDLGIGEQRLERAEPERALRDPGDERRARASSSTDASRSTNARIRSCASSGAPGSTGRASIRSRSEPARPSRAARGRRRPHGAARGVRPSWAAAPRTVPSTWPPRSARRARDPAAASPRCSRPPHPARVRVAALAGTTIRSRRLVRRLAGCGDAA